MVKMGLQCGADLGGREPFQDFSPENGMRESVICRLDVQECYYQSVPMLIPWPTFLFTGTQGWWSGNRALIEENDHLLQDDDCVCSTYPQVNHFSVHFPCEILS
jgi:hypothetical protein